MSWHFANIIYNQWTILNIQDSPQINNITFDYFYSSWTREDFSNKFVIWSVIYLNLFLAWPSSAIDKIQ